MAKKLKETFKTMDNKRLEEMKQKYALSDAELDAQAELIHQIHTRDKNVTMGKPFAVIVLGQPGAGKSGVMNFTSQQFPSAISLDIDDFRQFCPRYDELKEEDPIVFETVSGEFARAMIHRLTPRFIREKYNVVFHKTRGDEAVIYDTVEPLRENGYDILFRVMAVHELESKMSALERSLDQFKNLGFCRWVEQKYHNTHYAGVVDLSEKFEQEKLADSIEVFVRGKKINEPVLVYAKVLNPRLLTNPYMQDANGYHIIGDYNNDRYTNVRNAINNERSSAVMGILESYEGRLDKAKAIAKATGCERAGEFISECEQLQANNQKSFN